MVITFIWKFIDGDRRSGSNINFPEIRSLIKLFMDPWHGISCVNPFISLNRVKRHFRLSFFFQE